MGDDKSIKQAHVSDSAVCCSACCPGVTCTRCADPVVPSSRGAVRTREAAGGHQMHSPRERNGVDMHGRGSRQRRRRRRRSSGAGSTAAGAVNGCSPKAAGECTEARKHTQAGYKQKKGKQAKKHSNRYTAGRGRTCACGEGKNGTAERRHTVGHGSAPDRSLRTCASSMAARSGRVTAACCARSTPPRKLLDEQQQRTGRGAAVREKQVDASGEEEVE